MHRSIGSYRPIGATVPCIQNVSDSLRFLLREILHRAETRLMQQSKRGYAYEAGVVYVFFVC